MIVSLISNFNQAFRLICFINYKYNSGLSKSCLVFAGTFSMALSKDMF